jgi:hypothetical protein
MLEFFELTASGPGVLPRGHRRRPGRDRQRRPAAAALPLRAAGPSSTTAHYFGEPVRVGLLRTCCRAPGRAGAAATRGDPGGRDAEVAREFTRTLVLQARARHGAGAGRRGLLVLAVAGPCGRWHACATRCDPLAAGPDADRHRWHPGRRAAAGGGHQPARRAHAPARRRHAALHRRRVAPAAHAADHRWPRRWALRCANATRRTRPRRLAGGQGPTRRNRAPDQPDAGPGAGRQRRVRCASRRGAGRGGAGRTKARAPGGPKRRPASTSGWTCRRPARARCRPIRPAEAEALSNLLHNALRYTPAGGQVTVRVRPARATAN